MNIKTFAKEVIQVTPSIHASFIRNMPADLKKGKITISQMLILEMLQKNRECRMSDISISLGVTKSAITALTDRLIKTHLVMRSRSQKDRRVVRARLTQKGLMLANRIRNYRLAIISRLFSGISRSERAEYLAILKKVQRNLAPRAGRKTNA